MHDATSELGSGPALMGIVVVNYASSRLIEKHLGPMTPANAEVVIVDNLSGKPEREAVRRLSAKHGWTLVEMDDNRGFSAGVNAGVRAADRLGCECFLLLNPDAQVTAATIDELRRECLNDRLALISPCLVDSTGQLVFAGSTLNLADGRIRSLRSAQANPDPSSRLITWLTAACLVVHRDLWQRAGGFDESYFMYWEDVDFNYRCLDIGGHVLLRKDLVALHDQGGTQGPRRGRAKSALYYHYNCRNRLVFGARYLAPADLLRWFMKTPIVSWEIFMRGGRRQLLHSPWLACSAFAGALSGMSLAAQTLVKRFGMSRLNSRAPHG